MLKTIIPIRVCVISILIVLLFISCKQEPDAKKEAWAVVFNFFSPDTTYFPVSKHFPFPDSLRFAPLTIFFTNQNKPPIINDSAIIFYDNYEANGEKVCCRRDTLDVFIDSIKGKKYLFAVGEYIAVFQSNNNSDTNLRVRKEPVSIPLWDIQLNTPYPPGKFKNEYEKLGTRRVKLREEFDEVSRQKWNDHDSISVETIQFNNSPDRIVTAIYKDMNETEVDSIINYVKKSFPGLTYKEAIQRNSDGKPMKVIRILFQGLSITFTQVDASEYSFLITDYYETIKLIINNAEAGYIFRDDITIY